MARIRRHSRTRGAALFGLVVLTFAPALAQEEGAKGATDLYDRPVLAIDPGKHTAAISSQAVDAVGRFAVTGGDDRTVRVWSVADGKLSRTIWIPVGPEKVGDVYAVAISPDGFDDRGRRLDGEPSAAFPDLCIRPRVRNSCSTSCRRSA